MFAVAAVVPWAPGRVVPFRDACLSGVRSACYFYHLSIYCFCPTCVQLLPSKKDPPSLRVDCRSREQ